MKLFLTVTLVASGYVLAIAQDFNHYKTLVPTGTVPKDFTDRSADKFTKEVDEIEKEHSRRERRSRRDFYLESTFGIDDFLASGSVLFNDDVSQYVSGVLTEVLKPYPELQGKLRVYTVKTASANAFTTNNGIIFVNLGLLARLDNEAQLAFILAHEVTHYRKKHVIDQYVAQREMEHSRDYRELSSEDKAFAKSSYSQELEIEADLGAIDIYSKTSYSKDSIAVVFDILRQAHTPLHWMTFDKRYFESPKYIFPDTLIAKNLKEAYTDDDFKSNNTGSHPDTRKRKRTVARKFREGGAGDLYRVSKSWFEKSRKIARFELCRIFLLDHSYVEALALGISLQQQDPESAYLRETVAKALYGLGKERLERNNSIRNEWAGAPAYLAEFFNRQAPYEIGVMALRELYKCHLQNPTSAEINVMLDHMIRSLAKKDSELEFNFLRSASEKVIQDLDYPYTQYAFVDMKNNDEFFERLDKQIKISKDEEDEKKWSKKKRERSKKPLDVDKVVVVNPLYRKIDIRKRQKVRHIQSEEVLNGIDAKIRNAANKLDINADIINPNNITSSSIAVLQSNSILNDWLDEQTGLDEARVSPIYNEVAALSETYKTEHFAWMGCISVTHKRHNKAWLVIGSAALPTVAPLLLPKVFIPQGRTLYFGLVFNVITQQLELVDLRQMPARDTPNILQSNIYYTLLKLKKVRL
jgi:beta-barrel assembly-enhancing protease